MRLHFTAALLLLAAACDPGDSTFEPDAPEHAGGKADEADVDNAITDALADGLIEIDEVPPMFDAAGDTVNEDEMAAIADAILGGAAEVDPKALALAFELAAESNLTDTEKKVIAEGVSLGGTEIPDAVRELLGRARLNGAVAFDVRDTKTNNAGETEGKWSPYPSTSPPVGNMAFDYTEITPKVLAEDIADTDVEYNAIVGIEKATQCDPVGSTNPDDCFEFEQVRYEKHKGGTGNVAAQFDEVWHPDLMARGSSDQKWSNNCAITMDGALHCLPAARRSVLRDLILTNPHLSRCNEIAGFEDACTHLLFMGHVDIDHGVVRSIELSGRLSKRAAKGQNNFIDPLALFEAWGFQLAPGLRMRWGSTEDGVPVRDLEAGVITEP